MSVFIRAMLEAVASAALVAAVIVGPGLVILRRDWKKKRGIFHE